MASSVASGEDRLQTSSYSNSQSPIFSVRVTESSRQSSWSTLSSSRHSATSPSPDTKLNLQLSPSLKAYEKCLRAKYPRGSYPDIGFPMESGAYPNSGFPDNDIPTPSGTPRYGYPSHGYPETSDLPGVIKGAEENDDDYDDGKGVGFLQLPDPGKGRRDAKK